MYWKKFKTLYNIELNQKESEIYKFYIKEGTSVKAYNFSWYSFLFGGIAQKIAPHLEPNKSYFFLYPTTYYDHKYDFAYDFAYDYAYDYNYKLVEKSENNICNRTAKVIFYEIEKYQKSTPENTPAIINVWEDKYHMIEKKAKPTGYKFSIEEYNQAVDRIEAKMLSDGFLSRGTIVYEMYKNFEMLDNIKRLDFPAKKILIEELIEHNARELIKFDINYDLNRIYYYFFDKYNLLEPDYDLYKDLIKQHNPRAIDVLEVKLQNDPSYPIDISNLLEKNNPLLINVLELKLKYNPDYQFKIFESVRTKLTNNIGNNIRIMEKFLIDTENLQTLENMLNKNTKSNSNVKTMVQDLKDKSRQFKENLQKAYQDKSLPEHKSVRDSFSFWKVRNWDGKAVMKNIAKGAGAMAVVIGAFAVLETLSAPNAYGGNDAKYSKNNINTLAKIEKETRESGNTLIPGLALASGLTVSEEEIKRLVYRMPNNQTMLEDGKNAALLMAAYLAHPELLEQIKKEVKTEIFTESNQKAINAARQKVREAEPDWGNLK
ncbi:MAG: hypothetical protein LBI01_04600 [Elusimicrobium sp.]|nr:hypothetical protein [Elusimicrobium sp.]